MENETKKKGTNKKTIIIVAVIAVLVVAAVLAYVFWPKGDAQTAGGADVIKIGGLAPLTGDVKQYGEAVKEGVDLYVSQLNEAGGIDGKQVQVVWQDEKGDVTEAINAYNLLVENEKVVAIIGDVTSKPTLAVAEEAAKIGIPMITASATAYDVTTDRPNVFRSCFLDPFQATTMANFAKEELNAQKVAVIYDNGNDYSVGLYEAFQAQVEANGMELVAAESSAETEVDFRALLTKIAQGEPDALYVAYYYTAAALVVQQATEMGMEVKFLGADGINGIEKSISDTAMLEEKFYYSDHFASDATDEAVVSFKEAFQAKYDKEVYSAFNATGYDAALVLCEAIKNAGSTDYAQVVEAMKKTDVTGVTGKLTFDEHNDPIKSAFIMTFKDGQQTFVKRQDPQ